MLYYTIIHYAVLYSTITYYATLCYTDTTTPYHSIPYYPVPHYAPPRLPRHRLRGGAAVRHQDGVGERGVGLTIPTILMRRMIIIYDNDKQ